MVTHTQNVRRLYKTVLKLNRGLPPELHLLGNEYARTEFKRHKTCNSEEAKIFIDEWSSYAVTIAEQLGLRGPRTGKKLGSQLDSEDLQRFRDEQIQQLYELKIAAFPKSANSDK